MVLLLLVDNNAKRKNSARSSDSYLRDSVKKKVRINFENCNELKKKWGNKKGNQLAAF